MLWFPSSFFLLLAHFPENWFLGRCQCKAHNIRAILTQQGWVAWIPMLVPLPFLCPPPLPPSTVVLSPLPDSLCFTESTSKTTEITQLSGESCHTQFGDHIAKCINSLYIIFPKSPLTVNNLNVGNDDRIVLVFGLSSTFERLSEK